MVTATKAGLRGWTQLKIDLGAGFESSGNPTSETPKKLNNEGHEPNGVDAGGADSRLNHGNWL